MNSVARFEIKDLNLNPQSQVSLIVGVTRGEGGLLTSSVESSPELQKELKSHWHNYSCLLNDYPCTPETEGLSAHIRDYYFGQTPNKDPTVNLGNLTKMISETVFWYPAHKAAMAHSRVAPTRLYFYNYTSSLSLYPLYRGGSGPNGIPQSVDIGLFILQGLFNKLLFILDILKVRFSSQEYKNWGKKFAFCEKLDSYGGNSQYIEML